MMQGERFEDYKLVFACPETLTTTHGAPAPLSLRENGKSRSITPRSNNIPTLLFEHVRSPYVTLTNLVKTV